MNFWLLDVASSSRPTSYSDWFILNTGTLWSRLKMEKKKKVLLV